VRLLPRFRRISSKTEMWRGGPQVGEVVQAQLTPPAKAKGRDAGEDEAPAEKDHTATHLLLLLR
jgi:hypothetical protein